MNLEETCAYCQECAVDVCPEQCRYYSESKAEVVDDNRKGS
jgi:hypothetical protein